MFPLPRRSLTLHFSFLNVDKHSEWMVAVLEYAQDAMQIDTDEDEVGSRKVDYTGYVLALNGHKKYLCLSSQSTQVKTWITSQKRKEEVPGPGKA